MVGVLRAGGAVTLTTPSPDRACPTPSGGRTPTRQAPLTPDLRLDLSTTQHGSIRDPPAYVPAVAASGLLFLSGMLPLRAGAPPMTGRLGAEADTASGREAARTAALNALAVIDAETGLDSVTRVVRLALHIACDTGFRDHAAVADGASEVFDTAFAPTRHSRLVFGSVALPGGMSLELDLILESGGANP